MFSLPFSISSIIIIISIDYCREKNGCSCSSVFMEEAKKEEAEKVAAVFTK